MKRMSATSDLVMVGQDSATPQIPNGAAVAACWSAVLSFLALAIAVLVTYGSDPIKAVMMKIGAVLPVVGPGANGPYAGHETVMLYTWIISWPLLHFLLRKKQFKGPGWLIATLSGVGLATLLLWPPVYQALRGGAIPPPH